MPLRIALATIILLGACSSPPSPDLASEERAIRVMDARWQRAVQARDAAGQAQMYASDGVAYRSGEEPLMGPAAIQAWEAKSALENPRANISWTTDRIHVAATGDIAVQTGEARITGLGRNGEDRTIHRERFVTVWRKVNGEWKVAHDIASSLP